MRGAGHRLGEVSAWRDGEDRHRFLAFLHDPDETSDAVLHDLAAVGGEVVALEPGVLMAQVRRGVGVHPPADRDVRPAHGLKESRRERRAIGDVARRGEDELEVEFRASQQVRQRPRIIDIRTDIGIQDDRNSHEGGE